MLTITASAPAWASRQLVALGAQLREDALAVDQRLRAAERDEGDARRGARVRAGMVGHAHACHARRAGGKATTTLGPASY